MKLAVIVMFIVHCSLSCRLFMDVCVCVSLCLSVQKFSFYLFTILFIGGRNSFPSADICLLLSEGYLK